MGRLLGLVLVQMVFLAVLSSAQESAEQIPQGASTLAFVFDVTGSMYDDLVQVIEGASKILETSLSRPKRPLYNFALVPFHDPEIGPVTITTDPKKFQTELQELYVQGGGDCPEMSIGAIKIALEISLPGSFIYVFTDARSKDYKLTHEVLKWVEEAVQSSKVHLLSTDHYSPVSNTWRIPFDPSLREVTVALSGPAPNIEIRNPQGKLIGKKDGLTELLHIPNSAKILNLKDPEPGMWSIKTVSEGRHSVRITGLSTIDFRAGFSRKHTLDFKMTSSRPVQGVPTFILLNTTGLSPPARADQLELLSITGSVIKTLPIRYYPDRKPYGIWNVTDFIPPKEAFFLRVNGYDRDGFLFQRVSSVSFFSIVPGVPKVSMPPTTPGYYLQKGGVTCQVESLIPFTLRFSREGVKLGMDQIFSESSNATWEISKVSLKDEGFYDCVAISTAGTGQARTFLDVSARPAVTVNPQNQTFSSGDEVRLRCSAKGYPTPTVVWTHNDMFITGSSRHRMIPDGTLVIRNAEQNDAGVYGCLASNVAGTDTKTALLSYIESPQVTVLKNHMLVGLGQTAVLECQVTGVPQPEVLWYKGDKQVKVSVFVRMDPAGTLSIQRVEAADAGDYICVAVNLAGTAQAKIRLDVGYLWVDDGTTYVCEAQNQFGKIQTKVSITVTGLVTPEIALSPAEVSVIEEQQVTLPCVLLAGNPLPVRNWIHDNTLVTSGPYVSIRRDGSLHIERVSVQDEGRYTCVAENVAGVSNRTTIVHVYVTPTIQHGPQVFSTIEGTPISLPCQAHGVPKPDITWAKQGELLDLSGRAFFLEEDGSLRIMSPGGNESGEFVCTATNAAGYSSRKVQLTVYVRPRPGGVGAGDHLGSRDPVDMSVTVGEDITLPCEVQSVPPPIITWAKDKQLISPHSIRHTQLPSGSMRITETRVTDSGTYLCVATNIAGNFSRAIRLSVYVPPQILPGPRVMKVQVEHSVDLPCVAQGIPQPSTIWKKDSTVLEADGIHYSQSADGTLTIQQVALSDEGVYKCMASNVAGQDEASIQLQVQGLPQPVIKWYRNGQELTGNEPGVSILEDGTLLILASVSPLDNGEYTCTAANDVGSTEKKYQLKVNVPPDVQGGALLSNVSVVINQPAILTCDVTGTPPPVITWFKDGVPVLDGSNLQILQRGKQLRLIKAVAADAGRYSCKAVNVAGSTEKAVHLEVLVPPSIIGNGGSHDLYAVLNQEISLECKVKGVPFPTIQWYKDRKLLFLEDPNVEVSDHGQVLKIKSARLGDQARYQCGVTNAAGKQSKDFKLSVYVPPSIKGGNVTTEVTALLHNTVTLECEVRGVPLPAITWYKNGEPILSSRQAQYVDRGHFLKLSRVLVSDAGHYTCRVTSVAGTADKSYELDVFVPPSISGGVAGAVEKKVVVSKTLVLECEAAGHPPPSLTWLKDGSPVKVGQNLRLYEQGRRIEIANAVPSDSGLYVCVATSIAGEMEIKYDVGVLVPPAVDSADKVTDVTVIINNLLELECHATGTPPPTITWLKDSKPVRPGEGVRILSNGRRLVIARAQVSDTALFQCVASNEAGETDKDFKVAVHEPPVIQFAGESVNQTILAGYQIQLQCKATGSPIPAMTWYKDSRPLTGAAGVSILNRGQVLEIERAQVSDAGLYKCVAVNVAGTAELTLSLQVYVPPSISSKGGMVTVVVNDPIRLECEASGLPAPTLTWLKEGSPVSSASNGIQVLASGSVLSFRTAQVSDAGRYICVAVNAGGEQQRDYDLHVYVPPNIMGEEVNSTVLIGRSLELRCQSDAIPPPTLSWRKDGRPLYRKPGLSVSEDGSVLQITSAQIQDTGRYTCEATNVAGKTEKNYNLNVWVPPSIRGSDKVSPLTVTLGGLVTLVCESSGIPPPSLIWKKNGSELKADSRVRVLSGGRQLQISNAERADAASYTCQASSVTGTAVKEYSLQVYVRPSISSSDSSKSDVTVVRGGDVTLQCEADGVPRPAITWLKDGRPLGSGSGVQILNDGRIIRIKDAQVVHTGRYTCIAVNIAGQDESKHDVTVHVPASISGNTRGTENVTVVVRNPVALTCEVSGIPLPVITWSKDGRPISVSGSVRIISGNPVPEITWLKDGQPVSGEERLQVMSHGRFLHITAAHVVDTGRYSCLASNSAGDRSAHFNLNVLVTPTIAGSGPEGSSEEVTVTLNSPTSLVCEAQSYPPAIITWLKDGTPFESSRNVRVLPGGRTLQILNAQEEDAGRYTCVATNEAGETLKNYEVKVYIPPVISKDNVQGEGFAPKEIKIKVNNTLTLECEAQAIPVPTLHWYKDGQILKADERITVTPNGRIVQIKQAQVSDTGRYTCVATNIAGEDEKDFDVNIQVPPSFQKNGNAGSGIVSAGELKDVILNNPISLYCETNAVPPPTLTWYKDGRPLTSNSRVLILPGGRVLQIPRAQTEDSGRYTCVAVNEAGEDSVQYDVRVLLPPSIRGADRDVPDDVTVLVNKSTLLECHVDGSPTPKISWLKDGLPLNLYGTHSLLSSGRTLQISNTQVTDTGRYACVAENVAGSAEKFFSLNVHVPPVILGVNEENATVVVNNFVALSCEATGIPPPTLSWLKDRKPIQGNSNAIFMPGGRTLQILKAKMSDGGKYSCVAINPAGEAHKIIYLTVFVPPSIRDSGGDSPVLVSVRVGNSITLECLSNAIPPPTITWYKNGRLLTETTNLRFLADGQSLEIKETEVSDTGLYVCKASNVAGQVDKNFHLNIYVPPSIDGPAEEHVVETISNPVTFACDATGIPHPSLTWIKNGRVIENSESLDTHILSGGGKLQIARSQLSHSGTYTCLATNVEGKAQKSYQLTIQVPPSITGSEMPSETSVLLNDSIQLVCRVKGTPTPTIQWLKDGKELSRTGLSNLRISPDGSTLTVTATQTTDGGKYTCVATNKAGEEDRIFNLNVYVPPVIQSKGDTAETLTTVVDSSVNIECVASGSPSPQINWLKNSLPLAVSSHIRPLSAGQVLRLDGAGSTDDVTLVKGSMVALVCVSDGIPTPSLTWMKKEDALPVDKHLTLLNHNSTLQLSNIQVDHTGRYTCVARNQAGEARRHFSLKVLDPPRINGSGFPTEVSVVVNHVLELVCEAEGIPTPTLTWVKDGRPLPQTHSLSLLRGGEVLRIASVQVEDTGRYSCLATSPAGDDDKEFLVRVHVPPNIAGESVVQNVSVLQNRQVTLECRSDAVPPPTLSWLKDGALLKASPRLRVLSSGRYLQINNAEIGDAGQYTCVASNVAGETRRHFNLSVNVAPTIKEGPQVISVHIKMPVVLECIVSGFPAPRVTWRKHGSVLAGNNPRYRLAEDGSLQIHSAQLSDTGNYLCMATNQAGTQRRRVDLQVYVPPSIAEGPTNITVTVNIQTTLSCEATGIPKPTVTWTKNTRPLNTDQNQNMYRQLSSGSLVVIAPTVHDAALYECVVSNEAGQDRRAIQLTVHVPPAIADEATELLVSRLSPVVISCTASGFPAPVLQWSKDGMKLAKDGDGYKILSSGALEIAAAELRHTGRYSCTANNAAGTAHRHVQVIVQEPPVILAQPSTLDVILNNHVTLPCRVSGTPRPTITWQKEGINIVTTRSDFTVLPNGGLLISQAKVEDTGTYICVAQNPAGTALGKTKLRVQVPPVITSSTKSYTIAMDGSLTLQCQTEGYPTPSVSWYKDGKPLSESVRQRVLSSGSLHIVFAQPTDTGLYTCTAANVAGSLSLEMSVTVLIPPTIRRSDPELWVVEDTRALLSCAAEGVPRPILSWEKEGIALTNTTGAYIILSSGELILENALPEDAGSYTCVATNSVGQDSQTIDLSVYTHPAFTEILQDIALNKGERLLLACGATGIPSPKITWAFNNNIIPAHYSHANGHSELVIERASKDDAGTYSCIAENQLGSIKSLGFVYVKEPPIINGDIHSNHIEPLGGIAILNCEVRGDPLPTIQWSKKGVNVRISNRIRQLDNGSLAIYGTVVEPVDTVVDSGSIVVLNCQAQGEPTPVIEWTRHGRPLLANDRITMLSNGSLRLSSAQKEDTSEYECVARNLLGSVLAHVALTVRVDGNWSPWQPWGECSASCGIGERTRVRFCNNPAPSNKGRSCPGDSTQLSRCNIQPCPGGPQKARGNIIGTINDVEFGIAFLNATIFNGPSGGSLIHATITNIPRSLGPGMRKLISLLNPIYWTTAQEIGGAVNGYTLTDGIFRRETQVEFATGEILRMIHVARGIDTDGTLLLDIVVNGHILQLPSNAEIGLKDYTEDYIQTGPGQLYALSTRMFSLDRVSVPYSWNHTILYEPSRGKMPYLVQTLHASSISAQYRPLEEILEFTIHASISKGERSNQCPSGFVLDPVGPYCADVNECQDSNPCHQHCLNTIGSFRCACEPGYQLRNRRCIDINECRQRVCRSDQQCKNTRGGYTCIDLCPTGMTKGVNGTCVDIDECRDGTHQCRYNQICENTRGSYHCTCPRGYRSQGVGLPCIADINECERVPMPCAQQCVNSPGSYTCTCPPGLSLLGDGKSCAGLERLPRFESLSYGFHTSQSSSQQRTSQHRYHSLTSQSFHSYTGNSGNYRLNTSRSRRVANTCPPGFFSKEGECIDINECEQRDICQHECVNTPGSHKCLCPNGYRLMTNGKTCLDVNECMEQNIQCGVNRMCFNMRGSYQCIDTPCPPNYQRDSESGFCLKNCPPNDLECALSPYALEYKLLSLPFGIAANQDLIRLVAYTQDGVMHPRTSFLMVDEDTTLPFALRDENLKGVLFTTRALRQPHTYRMKVRALSYNTDGAIEYRTNFIVYIAVSAYPY
ncbi:Hemicentin-1 [Bagarius yarrelli]|uniref:Hemicentin-1 n=1 Tax=Bagarius yarrelli TaxID=175774 RepID=A0A556TZD4_BAGYA|nr:Hemicentin-1 [Bagarius yarrelli]